MFTKRVKLIRDIQQEISILENKTQREISKFRADVEKEIEKRLKKEHPACRVLLDDIYNSDFKTNKRKREPFSVYIVSLNGCSLTEDNRWYEYENFDKTGIIYCDNHIEPDKMLDICRELSETLGVLVKMIKY